MPATEAFGLLRLSTFRNDAPKSFCAPLKERHCDHAGGSNLMY